MSRRGQVVGGVLCGGASRRMGTNKALLELDGVALAARVAQVLTTAGATPVIAIGGNPQELEPTGLEVIQDLEPDGGPLLGIISGLEHFAALGSTDEVIAVFAACDLPRLQPAAVTALIDLVSAGADAAVIEVDGYPQWHLVAIAGRAHHSLAESYDLGERSLRGALGLLEPARLAIEDLVDGDSTVDNETLADADTPEQWNALVGDVESRRTPGES